MDCADEGPVGELCSPVDDRVDDLPSLRLNWLWTTLSESIGFD